jgi:hypothetical protein
MNEENILSGLTDIESEISQSKGKYGILGEYENDNAEELQLEDDSYFLSSHNEEEREFQYDILLNESPAEIMEEYETNFLSSTIESHENTQLTGEEEQEEMLYLNTLIGTTDQSVHGNETGIINGEKPNGWYNVSLLNGEMMEYDVPLSEEIFPPSKNISVTKKNQAMVEKSGLTLAEILTLLSKSINLTGIREKLLKYNENKTDDRYLIEDPGKLDAVFTEAVHQFQIANYIDPKEHDGILGRSTLETLGFTDHKLKSHLNSSLFYGQAQLNKIKDELAKNTNNEFTNKNWFDYILKPSWLGIKISDGVHILLLRKLKEAEAWLLSLSQYKGLTPAELGKALGSNANSSYSAARLSSSNQAMHGLGLAIDINVWGDPWVGAGWIVNDKELLKERTHFIETLRKASGEKLPGNTIFAYLNFIAETYGNDTAAVYKILKQRNDEFKAYLRKNYTELKYWQNSATFDKRDPLNGFLNLHPDLVYALRQEAGLAWGAIDFGPYASGDIMHFDTRTLDVGKIICERIGGFVPKKGHPAINKEISGEILYEESVNELLDESEFHETFE